MTKKISKAQSECVVRYVSSHYDKISLTMPKGKRELVKRAAEAQGKSTNAFINELIDDALRRLEQ